MEKTKFFTSYALIVLVLCTTSVVYGVGSIGGTVTNTSSNGVPYATVVAVQDGNAIAGDTTLDGSYAGQYTISGLDAGTYDLHVLANGYEFRIEEDVVVTDSQQTTKNVTNLASEGKITGTVTKADETTAIEGVEVSADCNSEITFAATSDANGNYEIKNLPAETYTVTATDANYSFPNDANAVVTAGSTTSDVNLIGVSGKISGTVTKSDQQTAISDAFVTAFDANDDVLSNDTTDTNGDYELAHFNTSTYTVKVYDGGNIIASSNSVSVTDGSTTDQDFSAAGGSISGTVTDSNATAIQGAVLIASSLNKGGLYKDTTDGSGDYKIEELPADFYILSVDPNGNDYVSSKIDDVNVVANTETSNQDFTLTSDGKITGSVENSSQEAIEGAIVFATAPEDANSDPNIMFIYTLTDSSGDYTVRHLRSGTYSIYVSDSSYVSDIELNVAVTAGQTTSGKNFTLGTSGGKISGTVYESDGETPIPNALVSCTSDAGSFGTILANANGQYTLERLQATTYKVKASAIDFESETLSDIVVTGTEENSGNDFTLDAE
jgi:hypothetical protein